MTVSRRKFFAGFGKSIGYIALVASYPQLVWAKWNTKAFTASNLETAIKEKYGAMEIVDGQVNLKAPAIAENGAVVPIKIKTKLPNVKNISVFVKNNPAPLITTLHLGKNSLADVQIRIRMGKTSEVIALVESDGKLYRSTQQVKVTIGGCGG
jgi:sulfur-oxidizing protein SoxY